MSVRVATHQDLGAVAECLSVFGTVHAQGLSSYVHKVPLVYDLDGRVVGTCNVIFEEKLFHHYGLVAHIEDVAVLPEYRGRGYGKALIDHAIDVAKTWGCYKAILSCSEENVALYEKSGFRRHEVSMRLDLTPQSPPQENLTVGYFRKKPVVIQAIRYTGSPKSFNELWDWMGGDSGPNMGYSGPSEDDPQDFKIRTLEGNMTASPGDWIIKGVKGEFYPCKPDIFEATYEPVN